MQPTHRSMRAGLWHSPHRCKAVTPQESHPLHTFSGSPPKAAAIYCSDFYLNQTVNFIHTDGHSGDQSSTTSIRQYETCTYVMKQNLELAAEMPG